jgi:hypothetical protein
MLLGFHSRQLGERGTEVAMFNYARYARDLLGHEVRIYVPRDSPTILPDVRSRFEAQFDVVFYASPAEIRCDALHVIKRGRPGRITTGIPELNHAFFDVSSPHGHRFATISDWLARTASHSIRLPGSRTIRVRRLRTPPVVPRIVELPDVDGDLRSELGLPDDAVVFGRHGATDSFDLEFVKDAIRDALERRDDIWFVFLNTDRFFEHERIVHLSRVVDRGEIRRFVNSCDYMIHAHDIGETFGQAVAEFAASGAGVITYLGSAKLAHLDLLTSEQVIGYRTQSDATTAFLELPRLDRRFASTVGETYSAVNVMRLFDSVFLS